MKTGILSRRQALALTLTLVLALAILTSFINTTHHHKNQQQLEQHDPGASSFSLRSLASPNKNNKKHYNYNDSLKRIRSYDWSTSIAAVLNTPKTGTGGFYLTFLRSLKCRDAAKRIPGVYVADCPDDSRRAIRTHSFDAATQEIRQWKDKAHPDGKCLIVSGLRDPATWFASSFLQSAKENWKPTPEEMVQDFRTFLASPISTRMMEHVIPNLLREFEGGTLLDQTKIMDRNGGFSLLGPAPPNSALAGCDLLFLRMEDSERWPDIFRTVDSDLRYEVGISRVEQNPDHVDKIEAVSAYKLTPEERKYIYIHADSFIRDWFDSYGYVDDIKNKNGDGMVSISEKM